LIDLREALVDMPGREIECIAYHLNDNRFFNKMALVAARRSFTYAMGACSASGPNTSDSRPRFSSACGRPWPG
jgi:hypothetical protein